jgi:hypothetical protein
MRKLALASAALAVAAWLHATTRYDRARTLEFTTARAPGTVRIGYAEARCVDCRAVAVIDGARQLPLRAAGGAFTGIVDRLAAGGHVVEVRVSGLRDDGRWEIDAEEVP